MKINQSVKFEQLPRYLTPREAAGVLRISLASFYKKSWQGAIPTTRVGGSLRVDKNRLEKFLDENTRGGKK